MATTQRTHGRRSVNPRCKSVSDANSLFTRVLGCETTDSPFLLVDWLLKSLLRKAKKPVLLLFDEIQEFATAKDGEAIVSALRKEHYDLSHIIERDWATLAPKLKGKIHIYVGSGDNFFLTDSVYFAQERLEALAPAYEGTVAYGDRAEHCWNGDPKLPNAYSRLHYNVQYLAVILKRIAETAPAGADLHSWRY
jgi:hypothetical protein